MAEGLRLGFLLSGGGRTLENLAAYLRVHPELARLVLVISDRASAKGLQRAERLGIPHRVLPCRQPQDSEAIFAALEDAGANLAVLGGFLRLLRIPPAWKNRVLNIHPSLIPRHCGQGYYGDRVHAAVLEAGDDVTGCTVHFVDNVYDHGPVLLQEQVPVRQGDTVTDLAQRVFEAECRAYPRAIRALAENRVAWSEGQPRLQEETPP